MRRWAKSHLRSSRLVALTQLASLAAFAVLLLGSYPSRPRASDLVFIACLTILGAAALWLSHAERASLARRVDAERRVSAELERAVDTRTVELESAERVMQRMWLLGQQITLELDPRRVVDRFLEAVVDIVRADGGAVGMLGDDGRIHVIAAVGVGEPMAGRTLPVAGSMSGQVLRSGRFWAAPDIAAHRDAAHAASVDAVAGTVSGIAIVPIARRGEGIGVVMIGAREARTFGAPELERVDAMADLLSLALENAELVDTLRQAEWRFRTLFRAAPDAVLMVLQSGRVREANDAVRDVTGFEPLQVVGRGVEELVIEGDRDRLRAAIHDAFGGRAGSARITVTTQHPDGARRLVEAAIRRLPQADPPSVLLVGRDMTNEREMRQRLMAADRLAAVGELVAGVAHEVNNPLSSISAFAQILLRDGSLAPEHRESIEVIRSETARASQVVKDLLSFARRSEPRSEPTDLEVVVRRTLRLRGYELSSQRIQVELALADDLPAVMGDPRQLQQVCLNLVTNAVQAMSGRAEGGGTLRVSTRAAGEEVILEIRDSGPGIPEPARARIFEPFFTTKGEGEGTGLGLSVSYGIVTAHGGRIELAETSESGTTFRVTLPAMRLGDASTPAA